MNTGVDVFCSGYAQVSSINKNPVFAKYSASSPENAPLWCRTDYETTGDDGTGQGVVLDTVEGSLYGLFTATGDQGTADFGRWASNGWLRSYSDASPAGGGGAKVSIVAKIDPETGDPLLATFVTALLSSGKVNSVSSVIAAGWISQVRAFLFFRKRESSLAFCRMEEEPRLWLWGFLQHSTQETKTKARKIATAPATAAQILFITTTTGCGTGSWFWMQTYLARCTRAHRRAIQINAGTRLLCLLFRVDLLSLETSVGTGSRGHLATKLPLTQAQSLPLCLLPKRERPSCLLSSSLAASFACEHQDFLFMKNPTEMRFPHV